MTRRGRARPPRRQLTRRSVALLWGPPARATRGPKPALTLDAIVAAAMAVADREGLAALTMNRVAADLDVTPMALYRYVPGKGDLVALMIDRAVGRPPAPGGGDWRTEVARWARASLSSMQRHGWLLESIIGRVAIGPNWLAWIDAALASVEPLRLSARERVAVVLLVDGHVRAAAQISVGATATREWADNFRDVLRRIAGDPRYAALARVAAAHGFDAPGSREPDAFEFGLQRMLDGIEVFSRTRKRTRR